MSTYKDQPLKYFTKQLTLDLEHNTYAELKTFVIEEGQMENRPTNMLLTEGERTKASEPEKKLIL